MHSLFFVSVIVVALTAISMAGCSRIPGVSSGPGPALISPDPDFGAIQEKCFYPETAIPEALMTPLAEIVGNHTARRVYTERGTFRIEPGYFIDPEHLGSDNLPEPLSAESWNPALGNHPFLFTHGDEFLPHKPNELVRQGEQWRVTLYAVIETTTFYGAGLWRLTAEATLDPDTCTTNLERLVAGPDEIVLYPEAEP